MKLSQRTPAAGHSRWGTADSRLVEVEGERESFWRPLFCCSSVRIECYDKLALSYDELLLPSGRPMNSLNTKR